MIRAESSDDHEDWDDFVCRTPGGDVVQSTSWARFRRTGGFDCHRLVARAGDSIVGGMQIYARRVGSWTVAYLPCGPLIAPDAPAGVVSDLLEAVRMSVPRCGAIFVQPPMSGSRLSSDISAGGFSPCDVKVGPSATLRVDVSPPIEEVRHGLSSTMRSQIKRWPRMHVEVREGTRQDLGLLAELHALSAQHGAFRPLSPAYIQRLWDALAPRGRAELLIGCFDGQPVAADFNARFGGVVSSRIHGFDRRIPTRRARVPAALVWAAIVRAHERGEQWFDVGGMARAAAVALLEGRRDSPAIKSRHEFKLAFGAKPFLYPPPMQFVRSPAIHVGLVLARSIKPARRSMHRSIARIRVGPLSAGRGHRPRNHPHTQPEARPR